MTKRHSIVFLDALGVFVWLVSIEHAKSVLYMCMYDSFISAPFSLYFPSQSRFIDKNRFGVHDEDKEMRRRERAKKWSCNRIEMTKQ